MSAPETAAPQPAAAPVTRLATAHSNARSTAQASTPGPIDLPILLSRVLVAIAVLAQVIVAWRFWSLTWDDSAITLAFARTLAHTGRIEPTPGSGIVEGYSTTLWMLLMAAAARFVTSPTTLLAVAKISTLLLNIANILLMRRWFLSWLKETSGETIANLIAGSVGCGLMFYETINGMETPLILTLVLVMLLLFPRAAPASRLWYLLAGSAFLLTRWEAAWLLVPFLLIERTRRRALISSVTWLAVFIVSNIVRWQYFGSILPNTIIAKRGAPYIKSTLGGELHRHLGEPVFILASCKAILLVVLGALLYERLILRDTSPLSQRLRASFPDSWQLRFTLFFTLFSLILSTAIGANWGPVVRSFYCGWPFLFCLVLLPLFRLRLRTLTWATAALCGFALLRMFVHVQELRASDTPVYMPRAKIGDIADMASVLTDIQTASHHPQLVYAGPDMGAVMLYTNGVRVIDLGLLCDSRLAHQRYPAIHSYVLQEHQPDVIEVHDFWTKLTGLPADPLFLERYRPVYIDGLRVFLARALIADIDPARLTEKPFEPTGQPSKTDLQAHPTVLYTPIDNRLNQIFGTYLVLHN